MPSHARPKRPGPSRAVFRTVLTAVATGAALAAAGAAGASAATPVPLGGAGGVLGNQDVPAALGALSHLQVNPLAKTGVDPLDNSAGTQVADFQPVSTALATGPLSRGDSLSELPVVGTAARALPGV